MRESRIRHKEDQIEVQREIMRHCVHMQKINHPNYPYIRKVVISIYRITITNLLIQRGSSGIMKEIKNYEDEMRALSSDVYNGVGEIKGKFGMLVRLMRRTDYLAYWIVGLIPDSIKTSIIP